MASGIALVLKHPKVLRWALLPMLIQALLFVGVMLVGIRSLDDVVAAVTSGPSLSWLRPLLYLACVVLLLLAGVVFTLVVGGVLCDPFFDLVSEETEAVVVGRSLAEPFSFVRAARGLARELFATALRLALYFVVAIPLWLLGLTGVGAIVAAPLALAWTFAFVALEAMSRSQARHTLDVGARVNAVSSQRVLACGFGALGWLLAFIPFTMPFLVAGGTRMFLALAVYDRVPSRLTDDDKQRLRA